MLLKQKSPNSVQARPELPLARSFLAEVVLGAPDSPLITRFPQSLLIISIVKYMVGISRIKNCYLKRARFQSKSAREHIKSLGLCLMILVKSAILV